MQAEELLAGSKAVGTKETLKAVEKDRAAAVFIAKDAEKRVVGPVYQLCLQKGVTLIEVDSMQELGKQCKVAVATAACAVLK